MEELISTCISSPTTNLIDRLTSVLIERDTIDVHQWISTEFRSFVNLENWAWLILTRDRHSLKMFDKLWKILAKINRKFIFDLNDVQMKIELLLPTNSNLFDEFIRRFDDDEQFLSVVNLWFENVAFLNSKHIELASLPLIISINDRLMLNFIHHDTFINYLQRLANPSSTISIQQEFYLKIFPFFLNAFSTSTSKSLLFNQRTFLEHFNKDFIRILLVHCQTISTWSKEFLGCLSQLAGLMSMWVSVKITDDQLANFNEFLLVAIEILSYRPFHDEINEENSNDETILIEYLLATLIIFATSDEGHKILRHHRKFLEILEIFDRVKNERINLISYRIQSEILSEEQIKELDITKNIDEIFFRYLRHAWSHPLKMHNKIPIEELLKGFLYLSKNDIIKSSMSQEKHLNFLVDLVDVYPIIYDILWSLSFDNRIRDRMNLNENLRMKIERLAKNSSDEQMQKILSGLIWNLDFDRSTISTNFSSSSNRYDLMISYSHKDKEICQKIYEDLRRQGLKIWIDFNEMHGNMMDAMAQGIEQSQTILLCISEEYRRSNFCRAEAQYAFKRQSNLIPIFVQRSYKPDGWLLFLISGLLYIDFTKYEFDQAIQLLRNELKNFDRKPNENFQRDQNENVETKIVQRPTDLRRWTTDDVRQFLIEHRLHHMSQLLSDCTGSSLIHLHDMLKNNVLRETFLLSQQDVIQKTGRPISLIEVARFQSLMDEQIPSRSSKMKSFCSLM